MWNSIRSFESLGLGDTALVGRATATYPEIATFLTALGVDSLSVNPQSLARALEVVRQAEAAGRPLDVNQISPAQLSGREAQTL